MADQDTKKPSIRDLIKASPPSKAKPKAADPAAPVGKSVRSLIAANPPSKEPSPTLGKEQSLADILLAPLRYDLEVAAAAGQGALNSASLGAAPTFSAGYERSNPSGSLGLGAIGGGILGGAANVVSKWRDGEAAVPDAEYLDAASERMSKHPIAAGLGMVGGAVAPTALELKALQAAAKASPALAGLLNNVIGRVAGATAIGAAEGGATAKNLGTDVTEGAAIGGLLGGAAQGVLGEAAPSLLRLIKDYNAPQNAAKILAGNLDLRSGKPVEAAEQIDTFRTLGNRATLADMPQFAGLAERTMYDPATVDASRPLVREMNNRLDPTSPTSLRSSFSEFTKKILPKVFQRGDLITDEARHATRMAADLKKESDELIPQFTELYKRNAEGVYAGAQDLKEAAKRVFLIDGDDTSKALVTAHTKLVNDIARRTKKGKRPLAPEGIASLRREAADMASTLWRKATGPNGTAFDRQVAGKYQEFANGLRDDYLSKLFGFDRMNAEYRDAQQYKDAYKLGTSVFSGKADDLDQLPEQLAAMEDSVKPGFYEGFARTLLNEMDSQKATGAAMNKLSSSAKIRDAIMTVLPKDGEAFLKHADEAIQLSRTASKLVGGSDTGRRITQAASAELSRKFNLAIVLSALGRYIPGVGSNLPTGSTAAGTGAAQRLSVSSGFRPATNAALVGALGSKGTEGEDVLRQIMTGSLNDPRKTDLLNMLTQPGNPLRSAPAGAQIGGLFVGAQGMGPQASENRR